MRITTTTPQVSQHHKSDALSAAVVRYSRDWPHLLNHTHKSKTLHARVACVCPQTRTGFSFFDWCFVILSAAHRNRSSSLISCTTKNMYVLCVTRQCMNAIPQYASRKHMSIFVSMCDCVSPSGYVTEQQQGTHNDGVQSIYECSR